MGIGDAPVWATSCHAPSIDARGLGGLGLLVFRGKCAFGGNFLEVAKRLGGLHPAAQ